MEHELTTTRAQLEQARECYLTVLPLLNAIERALDDDHTNMVLCTVGDLGAEHEGAVRKSLAKWRAAAQG